MRDRLTNFYLQNQETSLHLHYIESALLYSIRYGLSSQVKLRFKLAFHSIPHQSTILLFNFYPSKLSPCHHHHHHHHHHYQLHYQLQAVQVQVKVQVHLQLQAVLQVLQQVQVLQEQPEHRRITSHHGCTIC